MSGKAGTRIRYEKTDKQGILKSVKNFVSISTGARYEVFLDTNDGKFRVRNVNSRHYVIDGVSESRNLNVLKRNAKKALEKLGVSFEKELARDNSSRIPGENCAYGQKSSLEATQNQENPEETL